MDLKQLQDRYKTIPIELKQLKRWVGYRVETSEDGKPTKRPYNVLSGKRAKVNDSITWSRFDLAISGCVKYGFDGIGFMLGDGIFGVDLDNHGDMDAAQFGQLSKEFVDQLDSYTEWSQSGKGVHIICYGTLPEGGRRKGNVEMYDTGRFFACTGNTIKNIPIQNREKEIVPLWEKYVKSEVVAQDRPTRPQNQTISLSDRELLERIQKSNDAEDFNAYFDQGDTSRNGGDNSAADLAFCCKLAFWTNSNKAQMDRIFRMSALYRRKWDELRGNRTYGEITLDKALSMNVEGYVPVTQKPTCIIRDDTPRPSVKVETTPNGNSFEVDMNIDENGDPIFKEKQVFGAYSFTDTGNAMRFYDYFGEYFRYNVTDKVFMFWTGKTWIKDTTNIIRKYANKFIDYLKEQENKIEEDIKTFTSQGDVVQVKLKQDLLDAARKNTARVGNKAGKDAMLNEFQSLKDIPVESSAFNNNDFILNTESGIVDLRTCEITAFDKNKMCSKNTNIKVSFEEPKVWIEFLKSVFNTGNEKDTQDLIDSMQTCLGYSLSGSTREQVMFLLYGKGSNGKSTLTEEIAHVLGDYGDNIKSDVLMQQKNANNSTYSIAKLQTTRFVETGETDDGGRLAESQVKILTGGDSISAQFKYGNEFSFKPKFKIWMSTNNRPNIRGTELGIWRRLVVFPFKNTFTDEQKDKDLPDKLKAESDKILGWCIKGFQKYQELNGFIITKMQEDEVSEYKQQMDVVSRFIAQECRLGDDLSIDAKELYKKFKEWADDNTDYKLKESKFSENLIEKGITPRMLSTGKVRYIGITTNGAHIGDWE